MLKLKRRGSYVGHPLTPSKISTITSPSFWVIRDILTKFFAVVFIFFISRLLGKNCFESFNEEWPWLWGVLRVHDGVQDCGYR
jgi:hypothetical protein